MEVLSNKTKEYIKAYTKSCGNELVFPSTSSGWNAVKYHEWLTPENAESVCLIERGEVIESVCSWLKENALVYCEYLGDGEYTIDTEKLSNDMKDFLNKK